MPTILFSPEEAAINAGAIVLRQQAEAHLRPTTYGWADAYVFRTQGGLGFTAAARRLVPTLPKKLTTDRELAAWTIGLLGRRVRTDGAPSEPAPPEGWQERISRELAQAFPEQVPTLAQLRTAWENRPTPRITVAALLQHLGLETRHRTNITNALAGNRDSLSAAQRQLLGTWLLPQ